MKLLRDPLGRPIKRLYFKTEELDDRCERIVVDFMDLHAGGFGLPIPTDDLIRMIEAEADDLDMYAVLPQEEDGHTDFFFDRKPRVLIAKRLSDPRYKNRLRTTLGHEYGHVWFHAPLWRNSGPEAQRESAAPSWTCHRDTIVTAPENDWMEWQAAYISGALLMPRAYVLVMAGEIAMRDGSKFPLNIDSDPCRAAVARIMRRCQVSEQAARVRLMRLGILAES
ncbi:MAG: ImmA/IrrE family metallo-endopeptidase [Candidatus Binataceae bacterium]